MANEVTVFRPYGFVAGEKIRIEGGSRAGDWLVLACSEKTVTLRCPISGREFEWPQFCYQTRVEADAVWPGQKE